MKAPKKPREPYPIQIPESPRNTVISYCDEKHLFSLSLDDKMTIADFSIMTRAALEAKGLSQETPISISIIGDVYDGFCEAAVVASVAVEKENKNFARECEAYKKALPKWIKLRVEYEKN